MNTPNRPPMRPQTRAIVSPLKPCYDLFSRWNVCRRTTSGKKEKLAHYISYFMSGARDICKSWFSAVPAESLRRWAIVGALVALFACQAAPSGPEGSWSVLPPDSARLALALPDLRGEARHVRFRSADGRYVEETAQWGDAGAGEPTAGLRLSEASPGPPLTDPAGPEAILPGWTDLQDKRPALAEAGSSQNALGPASWWRVGVGTSVCVVFLQRLAPHDLTAATLSGFYCNPPGTPLAAQAAATVVQAIGLRPCPQAP
jgi:hypothetical protein